MLRQSSDLILVILVVIVSVALILAAPGLAVLRIVCAFLLLLVLPGYSLTAALFPGRFLDLPQRMLFSLGLSFAVAALTGLILNLLNLPLQLNTWASVLAAFTILMAFVAGWRRRSVTSLPTAAGTVRFRLSWREALLMGLAVLATGAALQLARLPTSNSAVSGYTQLWMVPANDGSNQLRVGVDSKEFDTTRYNVQLFDNGRLLERWPDLELEPGGSWQTSIELAASPAVTSTIEARLYRSDDPEQVYRRVSFVHGEQKD